MRCPNCENEMIQGNVQVRSTAADFLAVGFSSQHLFFDFGDKYYTVLHSGQKGLGHYCPGCSYTIIQKIEPLTNVDPVTGVVTEYDDK
ncbi:MAG: hypothetical protein OEV87_07485 [Phycisphaerae bacterium]|nr:hypothetical protein [Phycisphaerae bacterium]